VRRFARRRFQRCLTSLAEDSILSYQLRAYLARLLNEKHSPSRLKMIILKERTMFEMYRDQRSGLERYGAAANMPALLQETEEF